MVGLLCGVWSSGCCGLGVGSSGRGLPLDELEEQEELLVREELLDASPLGRVDCFSLAEGPDIATATGV